MRTLRFNVDGQIIKKDSTCDFDNLVPGTRGYLQASFSFSPEWDGFVKVAEFTRGNTEYEPQILKDGRTCMIPTSALLNKRFCIRILGKKGSLKLVTGKEEICQNGGKV